MSVARAQAFGLRGVAAFAAALVLSAATAGAALAQGVTTGAVRGRVTEQNGTPVAGASVQLVNRESGARFSTVSSSTGSYFVANVIVGEYTVEARSIGYRPVRNENVHVALGQVSDVDLQLQAAAVELEPITVGGAAENTELSRGRTGASARVTEELIRNLPSLNHAFTDFTRTSTQVSSGGGGAPSIAGWATRFNTLQIDGGSNSDLFGLQGSGGTPGGANDSRPLSVEAVREYQVLVAPFDVRQGGFTGGLINAVTRSGTNQLHGSLFGYVQDNKLQGHDTAGVAAADFTRRYYGFTVGGPIIRNRLHFFVAGDWRHEETPSVFAALSTTDTNNLGWTSNVGLSARTAQRIRDFAINTLGFDPGGYGIAQIPNPDRDIFVKLSAQLGTRSQAELAYNNTFSTNLVLSRSPFSANPTRLRDGWQFDNSGYDRDSHSRSLRGRLNTQLSSRLTNELITSWLRLGDVRVLPNRVSLLVVSADSANANFVLGAERFSQANELYQNIIEIQDNITYSLGNHVLTLGGRLERFSFRNVFFPASLGAWYFPDTTHLFNQQPTRYERALPGYYGDTLRGRRDGPIADFIFKQYGVYGQDQITVARWTLTLGLRADYTSLPAPAYNSRIDSALVTVGPRNGQLFGVRTDNRPTNVWLVSPRFGFNYDVNGDRSLLIRGGAGIFSGRTPYVWASNAYTNTGLEQLQLTCQAPAGDTAIGATQTIVPGFTVDPASQPTSCRTVSSLTLPRPAIVYFDQNFKLPQSLRLALGADRRMPWNTVGSVDLLYSRAINQFILEDVNLVDGGHSLGEAGRQLYGTLSATSGSSTPRRATTAANDVLRQFNSSRDYTYSVSLGLVKRFSNGVELSAGYAYSRSSELISPMSDISNSLLNFATLDGTFAHRNLRPSHNDQPHLVRLSGTTDLPLGLQFSLFYTGSSGRPYSYRYNSDVNGDGFSGNDLFYVPRNQQDISLVNVSGGTLSQAQLWNRLNTFIEGEKCLREARGRIMDRNSCRNPWQSFLDARLSKSFTTVRGQSVELIGNFFNVLALLGIGGKIRATTTSVAEAATILTRTGYSTALGRGIYSLLLPSRNQIQIFSSRWKMEFGMRYNF